MAADFDEVIDRDVLGAEGGIVDEDFTGADLESGREPFGVVGGNNFVGVGLARVDGLQY